MYKSFGEFIIKLHDIDEDAARWAAIECLKVKAGEKSRYISRNLIEEWKPRYTINSFMGWAGTPQGHGYWSNIYNIMEGGEV